MATRRYLPPPKALSGKTVAVTGTTGGLGRELCRYLAACDARLLLLDRSTARSEAFREELMRQYSGLRVRCLRLDLEDIPCVKAVAQALKSEAIDIFIHNAGAYSIPRHTCETGFDNVFQINFASPYYIIRELLPTLAQRNGHVVVVGSIAHTYSRIDPADIDFSRRKQASKVYGNAKRFLMFSLYELFEHEQAATLAVTHPGITLTNITAHYPPWLFALIKHPMKVIFMKPKTACLSILRGVFEPCGYHEWIGPRFFDVWGAPRKAKLCTCSTEESRRIGSIAEEVYQSMKKQS